MEGEQKREEKIEDNSFKKLVNIAVVIMLVGLIFIALYTFFFRYAGSNFHIVRISLCGSCQIDFQPCSDRGWRLSCENVPVACLLYTSDAADDLLCVDLGGRRIIKKKKKKKKENK